MLGEITSQHILSKDGELLYIDNCNFRLNLKTKESKQTVACLASRSMINNPGLLPPSVCLVGIAPFTKVLLKKMSSDSRCGSRVKQLTGSLSSMVQSGLSTTKRSPKFSCVLEKSLLA